MRTIVLVAAALAALPLTSIRAHADGAWCARDTQAGRIAAFTPMRNARQTSAGLADLATPTRPFKPITAAIKHTAATRVDERATGNIRRGSTS
jgi:hypothetical protein